MIDEKTLDKNAHDKWSSLTLLYPPFKELLAKGLADCKNAGLDVYPFETWRSGPRQEELFAQGRTRSGAIVTRAKPFDSAHQYGLAVDLVFGGPGAWHWTGDYPAVARIMQGYGLEWAGEWSWPEMPHFQKLYGITLADAKAIQTTQGILGVWAYIENLKPSLT